MQYFTVHKFFPVLVPFFIVAFIMYLPDRRQRSVNIRKVTVSRRSVNGSDVSCNVRHGKDTLLQYYVHPAGFVF